MTSRRAIGSVFLLSIVILFFAPFIGITNLSLSAVISPEEEVISKIFWQMRVPRVLLAFLGGSALSLGGIAFQSIFRNPLATPFTLGVASGASLGAMLYLRFGLVIPIVGALGGSISAFIGAAATIFIVLRISSSGGVNTSNTMLLTGVALSFFFSSLIVFIQYISNFSEVFRITRWLMGGFDAVGIDSVIGFLPFYIFGVTLIVLHARELNLLSLGEEFALSRGVDVRKVRARILFGTSILVGALVSLCGPIGFVGIMVPHFCRMLVGQDHLSLIPLSIFVGGAFLTVCDTLARTVVSPSEMPVGVITSLLGGPFFVWLLVRKSNERNYL